VALRLHEYALKVPGVEDYVNKLLEHPSVVRWIEMANTDPRRLTHYDVT
jgi:hypothetical protein